MKLKITAPIASLNKAYRKVKPLATDFNKFKSNLSLLLANINHDESEEHVKNQLAEFLKDSFYKGTNEINTKGRGDLVIFNGKSDKDTVGVLLEVKKPGSAEMITADKPNRKALHELILYFMRERLDFKNTDIKFVAATNVYEWFIFEAAEFDRLFVKNKSFVKEYEKWNSGQKVTDTTNLFYDEIAKPFIDSLSDELACTYFDLREFDQKKTAKRNQLALYKIFSPEHLLKKPFANDSNTLDKSFYNELLHIIGLEEVKDKNKKLIKRKPEGKRDPGSLLENTILMLKTEDRLHEVDNSQAYGADTSERLMNVALELNITWINRILFLKLLEAQLVKYHKSDEYKFLTPAVIHDYDELNKLFFQVLAVKRADRNKNLEKKYGRIPYLNSSLFEINQLERQAIRINTLDDNINLPVYGSTVLRDAADKRLAGNKVPLHYLFEFLDAYDFSADGDGDELTQKDNKTLINASVLGLIFEKINGYKDGSFFTPGFITMYMCRETIRRAVVQKFNEKFNYGAGEFGDLQNYLTSRNKNDILEYNKVVNSLTICDPAVGSGHFLVSALNEIIAAKSELGILADENGKTINGYEITIENDELIIIDNGNDNKFFKYEITGGKPAAGAQRLQKTLFTEKQNIIENSLFGVDINPNSVKIARLRLWIELLKNAYYTAESGYAELETLPNIDINIKQGNSLISRFAIDTDLKQVLKTIKWKIEDYRALVYEYKNTHDKERKREIQKFIDDIKKNFSVNINARDPKKKKLNDLTFKLHDEYQTDRLIADEFTDAQKAKRQKDEQKLIQQIEKLAAEIDEIETGEIYRDAFEWRFEFPEVLADNGDYIGFDIVIGNPPYISHDKILYTQLLKEKYSTFQAFADIFCYFIELSYSVCSPKGLLSFITSNSFLRADYGKKLRDLILEKSGINFLIDTADSQIFEDAIVNTALFSFEKNKYVKQSLIVNNKIDGYDDFRKFIDNHKFYYLPNDFQTVNWNLKSPELLSIAKKIKDENTLLKDLDVQIKLGIATGNNEAFIIGDDTRKMLIQADNKNEEIIKPILRGRDIDKYGYEFRNKYILLTRNEIKVQSEYPIIYEYLNNFGELFKKRGAKGKHWSNLRACSFFDDFKLEKIAWIELTDKGRFCLIEDEIYLLNSAYFLIPPPLINAKFLLAVLNSKVIQFYLQLIANTSGVGTTRWINIYVKEFPIVIPTEVMQSRMVTRVSEIITLKKENPQADTRALEDEIDIMVYKLYNLTYDEVKIVDPAFALTEEEYADFKIE